MPSGAETEKEKVLVRDRCWGLIRCSHRGVGGGHPSGAEGGLGVKTGAAGAPFRARGEGLGQLPDRARRHRGNQNLPTSQPRLRTKGN